MIAREVVKDSGSGVVSSPGEELASESILGGSLLGESLHVANDEGVVELVRLEGGGEGEPLPRWHHHVHSRAQGLWRLPKVQLELGFNDYHNYRGIQSLASQGSGLTFRS